jgi:hypothetical protein
VSPIPDLPPVEEKFIADASEYIAALMAMAAEAEKAAAAQERLLAAILGTEEVMNRMAAAADAAATAEATLASEEAAAARAAAEVAAAAAAAASAERDEAGAAGTLAAAENAAAEAAARLAAANTAAGASAKDAAAGAGEQAAADALAAGIARQLAEADATLAAGEHMAADAAREQAVSMAAATAGMSAEQKQVLGLAASLGVLNAANGDAARSAGLAATGFRLFGTGIRLTGTALHWIVAGAAEFLAVAIPALIAFGAGALVAAQGATNLALHMKAVYIATEATHAVFGQTVGSVLGLGSALQRAQDQANPQVYELLGSAVNDARSKFADFATVGLNVVHMLDEFAARITVDLQGAAGAQLHGLLSGMVADLQQFGQILGNIGHAILNFAAAMPGLARVLLSVADAISRVILWISQTPAWIITAVMAFEEFYRWGGAVLSLVLRLGGAFLSLVTGAYVPAFILNFGSALLQMGGAIGKGIGYLGMFITELAGTDSALGRAGAAVMAFGVEMDEAAAAGSAGFAALVAAIPAGIAILIMMLDRVRNPMQQFIDKTNQLVAQAPSFGVAMQDLATGMQQAQARIQLATTQLHSYSGAAQAAGGATASLITKLQSVSPLLGGAAQGALNLANHGNFLTHAVGQATQQFDPLLSVLGIFTGKAAEAASQVDQGRAALQRWAGNAATMITGAMNLGHALGTTAGSAVLLADAAGVNLQNGLARGSAALAIAVQQVRNFEQGLTAMGTPLGVVGTDIQVLGIQSQLAATKVQQLNSAWDAWIQTATAAATGMSQVEVALSQMGAGARTVREGIDGVVTSIGRVTSGVAGTTYTLRGFGTAAMQSWQQFTSSITAGNSALDTLRTGMAENVVTFGQFKSTVQGLVGQMAPFTQGNAAAVQMLSQLAHEAGGPVTTSLKVLEHWAGVTGNTARNQFAKGMLAASIAMGNMAAIAQHLSAVVGSQLTGALGAAIAKSSGLNQAMQQYGRDLGNAHTPATKLAADVHAIAAAEVKANKEIATGAKGLDQASKSAAQNAAAALRTAQAHDHLGTSAHTASGKISELNQMSATTAHRVADLGTSAHKAGTDLGTGMDQGAQKVHTALDKINTDAHTSMTKLTTDLHTGGQQAGQHLAQAITSTQGQVLSSVNRIVTAAKAAVDKLQALFHAAGVQADAGLASGILAGMGAVVAAAQRVAAAAAAALSAALHVHSPSKLTHQYGQWTSQGLAEGLLAGIPEVEAAARKVAESLGHALAAGTSGRDAAQAAMRGMPAVMSLSEPAHLAAAVTGASGGGYPQMAAASMPGLGVPVTGGGGPVVNVGGVTVQGHVLTSQQLGDLIREVVQTYITRNPDNGFVRRGRAS